MRFLLSPLSVVSLIVLVSVSGLVLNGHGLLTEDRQAFSLKFVVYLSIPILLLQSWLRGSAKQAQTKDKNELRGKSRVVRWLWLVMLVIATPGFPSALHSAQNLTKEPHGVLLLIGMFVWISLIYATLIWFWWRTRPLGNTDPRSEPTH